MILGAALSSTKSISLAGFNPLVSGRFTVGLWGRECSIFDLCLRRCRPARSPHLKIGVACAGKSPVSGVLFQHPLGAISNPRFVWSGSRVAQRVSVWEIYYFDLGNGNRSCKGSFRWTYKIQIRRRSMFSSSIVGTFSHRVLDSNIFAGDRAISIGAQILRRF